ncbi:MAG: hypothetical protein OXL34_12125 [Gemmatimonadota bacterium]|nr:hypothetical protein [Gemmatimonadota bacterium]
MPTNTPPNAATTPDLAGSALLLAAATVLTTTALPAPLNALPQEAPQRRPAETAIFSSAGHPDSRLSEIGRLGTALFLKPGRFVFVDTTVPHLVFVDIESGEVVSAGREGEGPGEFQRATLLSRNGDGTVFVWDSRQQRLSLVGVADGQGVVTQPEYDESLFKSGGPLAMFGAGSRPVAAYPDGTLIVRENPSPTGDMFGIPRREPGPYRDTVHYNVAALGAEKRLLAEMLGTESFSSVSTGGFQSTGSLIFGHELLQQQVGEHLAVAQTDLGSVRVFDRSGAVVVEIPLPPGKRASEGQIETARDRRIASTETMVGNIGEMVGRIAEERGEELRRPRGLESSGDRLGDLPANEIAPPVDRIRGDMDGRLWMRLFDPANTGVDPGSVSEQWLVWDISGPRLLFTVVLGPGDLFLDAAGDRVLLRTRDEFDVDYVVVREIVR